MGVVDFLASLPLFKHLNSEALEGLASEVRLIRFPEGHKIRDITRGTPRPWMAYTLSRREWPR